MAFNFRRMTQDADGAIGGNGDSTDAEEDSDDDDGSIQVVQVAPGFERHALEFLKNYRDGQREALDRTREAGSSNGDFESREPTMVKLDKGNAFYEEERSLESSLSSTTKNGDFGLTLMVPMNVQAMEIQKCRLPDTSLRSEARRHSDHLRNSSWKVNPMVFKADEADSSKDPPFQGMENSVGGGGGSSRRESSLLRSKSQSHPGSTGTPASGGTTNSIGLGSQRKKTKGSSMRQMPPRTLTAIRMSSPWERYTSGSALLEMTRTAADDHQATPCTLDGGVPNNTPLAMDNDRHCQSKALRSICSDVTPKRTNRDLQKTKNRDSPSNIPPNYGRDPAAIGNENTIALAALSNKEPPGRNPIRSIEDVLHSRPDGNTNEPVVAPVPPPMQNKQSTRKLDLVPEDRRDESRTPEPKIKSSARPSSDDQRSTSGRNPAWSTDYRLKHGIRRGPTGRSATSQQTVSSQGSVTHGHQDHGSDAKYRTGSDGSDASLERLVPSKHSTVAASECTHNCPYIPGGREFLLKLLQELRRSVIDWQGLALDFPQALCDNQISQYLICHGAAALLLDGKEASHKAWRVAKLCLKGATILENMQAIWALQEVITEEDEQLLAVRFMKLHPTFQQDNDVIDELDSKLRCDCLKEMKEQMLKYPIKAECAACGSVHEKRIACATCKFAHYCSRACQAADYSQHKHICKMMTGKISPEKAFQDWEAEVESVASSRKSSKHKREETRALLDRAKLHL